MSWIIGSNCDHTPFVLFLFVIDATLIIAYVFFEECIDACEEIHQKLHEIDAKSQNHDREKTDPQEVIVLCVVVIVTQRYQKVEVQRYCEFIEKQKDVFFRSFERLLSQN